VPVFRRIDVGSWLRYRNPVPLLQAQRNWSEIVGDVDLMAEYLTLLERFDRYMENGGGQWFARRHGDKLDGPIAYFCAEYGLHESMGIYSGGLGVLAGDHLKAASDMALPFIGVGLFYRRGYFRQTIDADGHQEHAYPDYDPDRLPLRQVSDDDGGPLRVPVELPGRTVWCAVWLAQVGRVPLLLLDSVLAEPIAPLLLAAAVSLWAAVFSAHALAFRAGSPLLGLIPPVAPEFGDSGSRVLPVRPR
jgi:glycogen phosphorylase